MGVADFHSPTLKTPSMIGGFVVNRATINCFPGILVSAPNALAERSSRNPTKRSQWMQNDLFDAVTVFSSECGFPFLKLEI